MKNKIKVIAFAAVHTLWVNEPYFQETEHKFCALQEDFLPQQAVSQELFKTEMKNLPHHTTWAHEQREHTLQYPNLVELNTISEVVPYLI